MISTPKSLRLQIALFGRTNVGKSSLLNLITNQEASIVSPIPGTTTDIVEKSMELLPIGPVTFLDTGGIDDTSILANKRLERTRKVLDRAEIAIFILEPNIIMKEEIELIKEIKKREIPILIVINKCDIENPNENFLSKIKEFSEDYIKISCFIPENREEFINQIKSSIKKIVNKISGIELPLLGDILPSGSYAIFIVPIDSQAPKGRLILPQVQAIRDVLDNNSAVLVLKDTEYSEYLRKIPIKPDLVVCDSQVVHKMVDETPADVKCTTFSILFARYKGNLMEFVRGVTYLDYLEEGDTILIAEACSHHPLQDDIGRIKIPRWLEQYLQKRLKFEVVSGRDFPEELGKYKLIIHCGSCMLTRTELLRRIAIAKNSNIPITNYGIIISRSQGVLERVLSPFPEILMEYRRLLSEKILTL